MMERRDAEERSERKRTNESNRNKFKAGGDLRPFWRPFEDMLRPLWRAGGDLRPLWRLGGDLRSIFNRPRIEI